MQIEVARRRSGNSIILTSLVDVMFVLLFFFMLASSYLDWQKVSLQLGGSGAGAVPADAAIVQVLAGGQFRLDGQNATVDVLSSHLKPGQKAVLLPGSGVTLQELILAMDTLKPTGAALMLGQAAP